MHAVSNAVHVQCTSEALMTASSFLEVFAPNLIFGRYKTPKAPSLIQYLTGALEKLTGNHVRGQRTIPVASEHGTLWQPSVSRDDPFLVRPGQLDFAWPEQFITYIMAYMTYNAHSNILNDGPNLQPSLVASI